MKPRLNERTRRTRERESLTGISGSRLQLADVLTCRRRGAAVAHFTVADGVRVVASRAAPRALILPQDGARDLAGRVLDGVSGVDVGSSWVEPLVPQTKRADLPPIRAVRLLLYRRRTTVTFQRTENLRRSPSRCKSGSMPVSIPPLPAKIKKEGERKEGEGTKGDGKEGGEEWEDTRGQKEWKVEEDEGWIAERE